MLRALATSVLVVLTGCVSLTPQQAPPSATAPPATRGVTDEIGSTRNAKVALARGADAPTITYFAREMSQVQRDEIAKLAPHLNVVVGLSRDEALKRAEEAYGADASYATAEFIRKAPHLVWIQAQSAGVDRYVTMPELADERIVLTNMKGVHGPAIADHAFAMLLTLTRDMPTFLENRKQGAWAREGSGELTPIALEGKTLLVVGLGGIGTEIAKRGHGFGMRVIAIRRSDDKGPDYVERLGHQSDLMAMLSEADVVAIAVPLTAETTGMFNKSAFDAMKPNSYVINIARGKVIDTGALVDALRSKRLAGACLDVTDPEPLPSDHELWKFPNVVITPHVASDAEITETRRWQLFSENLRRFDAGEPLLNVVDRKAGY